MSGPSVGGAEGRLGLTLPPRTLMGRGILGVGPCCCCGMGEGVSDAGLNCGEGPRGPGAEEAPTLLQSLNFARDTSSAGAQRTLDPELTVKARGLGHSGCGSCWMVEEGATPPGGRAGSSGLCGAGGPGGRPGGPVSGTP